MVFTPLFAVMLACAAVVYAVTGLGGAFDRDLLSVSDALLLVVLGLVLYGMSAREPSMSPDWMDRIQLVAVVSALVLDLMVLAAMIARIGDLGFTRTEPRRSASTSSSSSTCPVPPSSPPDSSEDTAPSIGSSGGKPTTCPSSPSGPAPSSSSCHRCSPSPEPRRHGAAQFLNVHVRPHRRAGRTTAVPTSSGSCARTRARHALRLGRPAPVRGRRVPRAQGKRHRALGRVLPGGDLGGDTLVGFGQASRSTRDGFRPGVTREEIAAGLRPLLDLPVEHVLATHDGPSDRAALERALTSAL